MSGAFPNLPDFVAPVVQMVFLNERSHPLSVEDSIAVATRMARAP